MLDDRHRGRALETPLAIISRGSGDDAEPPRSLALSLLSLSGTLYLAIIHGRDATPLRFRFYLYAWGLPLATAVLPFVIRDRRGSMYGTAGGWCWIDDRA